MTNRRLPFSLAALWSNGDPPRFCIRYRDISETHQSNLCNRIKTVSPITTIRGSRGPTVETIHEILMEINPIIFSEGTVRGFNNRNNTQTSRTFNGSATHQLSGYHFKRLCKTIFQLTCRKKPLDSDDMRRIAYLTTPDWNAAYEYVDQLTTATHLTNEMPPNVLNAMNEISLQEVTRAREMLAN